MTKNLIFRSVVDSVKGLMSTLVMRLAVNPCGEIETANLSIHYIGKTSLSIEDKQKN